MARNCIIPTPKRYVKKLLDSVGYKKNIIGNKILENLIYPRLIGIFKMLII